MKPDFATRREELLRERTEIEQQLAAKRAEYEEVRAEHEKVRAEHEQAIWRLQGELRVTNARLEEIENFAAALGPDFSGHAPLAGGPIEPKRRRPKRDLLALTLDYVQKYPGNTARWLASAIEDATKIRTFEEPILNKLEHLKASGDVRFEDGEAWTWWPTESHLGGSGDTQAPMDENHG